MLMNLPTRDRCVFLTSCLFLLDYLAGIENDAASGVARPKTGSTPVDTTGQKSVAESSSVLPNGNVTTVEEETRRGNGAAVASPESVALKMINLDGFTRSQVATLLAARGEDSVLLGREFMKHFTFGNVSIVDALRRLLKHVTIGGETQEQDRILGHFVKRYVESTTRPVGSEESTHTLAASVMLLNQDLHGENMGKRMTLGQFYSNLSGLCDGHDFPKPVLKEVYQHVKARPLLFASEDEARNKNPTPDPGDSTARKITLPNTFVEIDVGDYPNVIRRGFMKRKDTQGRLGHRNWSLRWCVVRGFLLHMFKPSSSGHEPANHDYADLRTLIVLTHAVARPATHYRKRLFVLELTTAEGRSILMQTSSFDDLNSWALAINFAAALHSAPPLPAATGSSMRFERPQLPLYPSRQDQEEQLAYHKLKVCGCCCLQTYAVLALFFL